MYKVPGIFVRAMHMHESSVVLLNAQVLDDISLFS